LKGTEDSEDEYSRRDDASPIIPPLSPMSLPDTAYGGTRHGRQDFAFESNKNQKKKKTIYANRSKYSSVKGE